MGLSIDSGAIIGSPEPQAGNYQTASPQSYPDLVSWIQCPRLQFDAPRELERRRPLLPWPRRGLGTCPVS